MVKHCLKQRLFRFHVAFSAPSKHRWLGSILKTLWIYLFFSVAMGSHFLMAQPESIEHHEKDVAEFTEKETEIINEMHRMDLLLNNSRRHASSLKNDISHLDDKINETIRFSNDLEKRIAQTESYASQRLVALYKLSQLGQLNFMASANSVYDFFYRKTVLEIILKQDEHVLSAFLENKATLNRTKQTLLDQKAKKAALEADVTRQIQHISLQMESRAGLLKEIRSKRALALAAIASFKESAVELNEKLNGFKKEIPGQTPYSTASPQSFSDLKGLLIMPVNGKIVDLFGPYTNDQFHILNFRSGINIKAERGEPIRAVYKGVTLFANWFKGYGNLIIIDHGDHYYTLYAHAEELFKKKGDVVEAGEVVATVGDSGSLTGPVLHFEVRHHGKPINPLPWIDQG